MRVYNLGTRTCFYTFIDVHTVNLTSSHRTRTFTQRDCMYFIYVHTYIYSCIYRAACQAYRVRMELKTCEEKEMNVTKHIQTFNMVYVYAYTSTCSQNQALSVRAYTKVKHCITPLKVRRFADATSEKNIVVSGLVQASFFTQGVITPARLCRSTLYYYGRVEKNHRTPRMYTSKCTKMSADLKTRRLSFRQ